MVGLAHGAKDSGRAASGDCGCHVVKPALVAGRAVCRGAPIRPSAICEEIGARFSRTPS